MPGASPARRAATRWMTVVLCGGLVVVLLDLFAEGGAGPVQTPPRVGLAFTVYQLLGLGLAVRAWRHPDLDRVARRAWGFMAVAFLLLSVSGALRPSYPAGHDFPSPADILRLAFAPVMLAGLLALPRHAQGRRERHTVWLDAVVVVVASAMLLWYVDVGPSVAPAGRVPADALAAAIAYPTLDLALIFGVSVVLFRGATESARRPVALLGLGLLLIIVGDVYFGHQQSRLGATSPDRWQLACWLSGHVALALAALVQCRLASRHRVRPAGTGARSMSILPYLAVVLGHLLLILAAREHPRILGLVAGAMVITGVVVARQVIARRQIHELATTDPLTGLVNRRQFLDRLHLALIRSDRNDQNVAVLLLDIKGFKHVNDIMGHDAGDQLLVAVGEIMRRNVLGGDIVGRLGGDEFGVVLHDIRSSDNAAAVARRIIADMRQPIMIANTPIQPHAAIGGALRTPGQLSAEELLDDADLAMCWAKRHTSASLAMYEDYAEESRVRADHPPAGSGSPRPRSLYQRCLHPGRSPGLGGPGD